MAKRAYSPKEIAAKTYKCLPWNDRWSQPFGAPTMNETWFISITCVRQYNTVFI